MSANVEPEAIVESMMITPGGMAVGWWIQLPVLDDGGLLWVQIGAVLPPERTCEERWALRVRRDCEDWWVKVAPHLAFPVCDVDPELT